MEKTIKVLMVEPMKEPYPSEVENTLEGLQSAVGGYIETVYLEDCAVLVCNEEGKLLGLPGNRSLGNDIITGTFFVAGSNDDGDFVSLTEDKIRQYSDRFQKPEAFTQEQVEDASAIFSLNFYE
ncbi:DUF3846 domain-containing protein [Desulfoscipio gibsoniae]|uniref:DUF3846 domain-containing protein n=1 Tax=Desulfoscipio gibsoniae DSM 7213 TaxID=767817 RepID=R4KI32_9FIRM|nr:DUF3846 domain-containing protein [Desulfoscipio gibsoniae]AGL02868.1 hypothetical protein Desgi_3545 [Desulfoscipio gibsoniae DSM 7213]